jgi:hypothetical protein
MTIEQEYLEKYINPRIKKLFEQANGQFYISPGNQTPRFVFEHNDMLDFVDLIVKEMCQVIDADCQLQMRQRVITNLGGLNQARELIKQHFGVES